VTHACSPDGDVVFPPYVTDPQQSPHIFRRTFLTAQQLEKLVTTEGWDREWVDNAIEKLRGKDSWKLETEKANLSIRMPISDDDELVMVVYAYQRLIDEDGAEQTVSSGNYYLDTDELRFLDTFTQPTTQTRSEAVRITYTAGYGAASTACPELDRMAIKLSLANRFENRDMIVSANYTRAAYEALVAKKMRASYP
jgi:hypothetical protein